VFKRGSVGCCLQRQLVGWTILFEINQVRVSSVTPSSIEPSGKPDEAQDSLLWTLGLIVKHLYQRLDRHLTAIAYAESGDLDAVSELLGDKGTYDLEAKSGRQGHHAKYGQR